MDDSKNITRYDDDGRCSRKDKLIGIGIMIFFPFIFTIWLGGAVAAASFALGAFSIAGAAVVVAGE